MTEKNKTDAWMPFYVSDYVADTMHLSTEEHGIYVLLMIFYWRTQSPIKNDKNFIKNVCKISSKKSEKILSQFFNLKDGYWHHKRIEKELAKSLENQEKKSERGTKGAEARWGKNDASSNASSIPQASNQALPDDMLKQCPSPTPPPLVFKNINSNTENESPPEEEKILKNDFSGGGVEDVEEKELPPDVKAALEELRVNGLPPLPEVVIPPLRPETYDVAKAYVGYDDELVRKLEAEWRPWAQKKPPAERVDDPDGAFIGFCRSKMKNGKNRFARRYKAA